MLRVSSGPGPKLDLASARILVVAREISEQDILAQILLGFGVTGGAQRQDTYEGAQAALSKELFDLVLLEADGGGDGAYDLLAAVRRFEELSLKQVPVILVRGHVKRAEVFKGRDSGANLILTKPISARVLFDHVLWLAQDHRSFVEADTYAGPDRRFKSMGPPQGEPGRRRTDLSATVGEATEANLTQDAVDDFFGAKKGLHA
jgi:DNA-binding response OmpR family regulator